MANMYETMLITTATLDAEAGTKLVDKFKSLIEKNGKIESVDDWGTRRLAYPINDENEGVYTLITFSCEHDFPAELDRVYKITDGVLRSMIIAKSPEEVEAAKKAKAAKEAAAAARAEAAKVETEAQ